MGVLAAVPERTVRQVMSLNPRFVTYVAPVSIGYYFGLCLYSGILFLLFYPTIVIIFFCKETFFFFFEMPCAVVVTTDSPLSPIGERGVRML